MKQILRVNFKQIRKSIPSQFKAMSDIAIKTKLDTIIKLYSSVAYYFAIDDEVDIVLPQKCILPATVGDILEFHLCDTTIDLVDGKFCKEPVRNNLVIPNAIVLPCLSFNRDGRRLGYGKGFYDKTLALNQYKDALKIAVAYSAQECEELPYEPHDVLMDVIITEHEVIYAKN